MFGRLRSSLTYANVASSIALFVALGTGGAYAADTIGSSDIIDEAILSQDIKNGEVKASELGVNSVVSTRINNGSVLNADLANNAVGGSKILDGDVGSADLAAGAVSNAKLQANSIDSGKVVDFGLSNQDVGVLFAEVDATGTLANSSGGGVTSAKLGALNNGQFEVDFGRDVSLCTAVATIGPAGPGGSAGEINVADRADNVEAVYVDTNDSAGGPVDRPFRLVVVC